MGRIKSKNVNGLLLLVFVLTLTHVRENKGSIKKMGILGCCGSGGGVSDQDVKDREDEVGRRETEVKQREDDLFEKQKQFKQEKKQFENDKNLGQVTPTFTTDEESAKKKKQDKELAELREPNAQQAKELTA